MDGWMDGWMSGWMDGEKHNLSVIVCYQLEICSLAHYKRTVGCSDMAILNPWSSGQINKVLQSINYV